MVDLIQTRVLDGRKQEDGERHARGYSHDGAALNYSQVEKKDRDSAWGSLQFVPQGTCGWQQAFPCVTPLPQ